MILLILYILCNTFIAGAAWAIGTEKGDSFGDKCGLVALSLSIGSIVAIYTYIKDSRV